MKLEHLKPGMTVYEVHSYRMGNTTLRSLGVWRVTIDSIDLEHRTVMASWNGNPVVKFFHADWSRWTLKAPRLIRNSMGQYRRMTKDEIVASKQPKEAA